MLKNITKLLFQWGGRMSRRQYVFAYAGFIIINLLFVLYFLILIKSNRFIEATFIILIVIFFGYVLVNIQIKRWHDLGYGSKKIIYHGLLFGFIDFDLLLLDGQKKINLYGAPVKHRTKIPFWLWIGFLFLFLIFIYIFGIKIIENIKIIEDLILLNQYYFWIKSNLPLF